MVGACICCHKQSSVTVPTDARSACHRVHRHRHSPPCPAQTKHRVQDVLLLGGLIAMQCTSSCAGACLVGCIWHKALQQTPRCPALTSCKGMYKDLLTPATIPVLSAASWQHAGSLPEFICERCGVPCVAAPQRSCFVEAYLNPWRALHTINVVQCYFHFGSHCSYHDKRGQVVRIETRACRIVL